ncbi:MAG TPA: HAD-IIIC family phosphatase [Pyrinomonadaceae bacterium]
MSQARDAAPAPPERPAGAAEEKQLIKCVVWDLDDTLWRGVLLEGDAVELRENVADIVRTLDGRGVLQSVASRNDHEQALGKLREFGLEEFFLYPQINWNSKRASIARIAELLNIGLDAVAFIDDQPFEREEVAYSLPQVLCLDAAHLDRLLELPRLNPRFVTEDSRARRRMYLEDIERRRVEDEFVGSKEEFLAGLGMVFTIARATREDLQRAEELTLRTNQLNTTGRHYSYDELDRFRESPRHLLLLTALRDKFGSYGKTGLALVECGEEAWTIKLLLMSCRVMSRNVGAVLLGHVMRLAAGAGVTLRADFVPNERNRMMYVTYKFAGFKEARRDGALTVLEHDLRRVPAAPSYVRVEVAD